MSKEAIFDNLFVLDMANNHQGSLEHGRRIILEMAMVCKERKIKAGIKFQYRDLDTFIHQDYRNATEPKHIKRFLSTRLPKEEFRILVDEVKREGLLAICTPFDENSVDLIGEHNIDIIKIASCSAQDWPLLERIALARKPVICSTGGASIGDIDKVVSFFSHRRVPLAIMHCVALYPTLMGDLQLNQIDVLKNRYPFLPIGFSTHEEPDNLDAAKIAVGKGAKLLERHVGLEAETMKLNAYSSTPAQLAKWIDAAHKAQLACGSSKKLLPKEEEVESLNSLKRGVYAKRALSKGDTITPGDVFFAMPYQKGQMCSGDFIEGTMSNKVYHLNAPIDEAMGKKYQVDIERIVYSCIHAAKGMLYQARIAIGKEFRVELSHHYGIEHFNEVGVIIIDVINREYCKKLLIQLPGQSHPTHYHKLKEETFQVLWGELAIKIDGEDRILHSGDQVTVLREQRHSFISRVGVIVEEVSTTHRKDDSFYEDPRVAIEPNLRKTELETGAIAFEQYEFLQGI